jgi:hypothetical protein
MKLIHSNKQLKKRFSVKPMKTKIILKMDNITIDLSLNESKELSRILEKANAVIQTEKTDLKESDLLGQQRFKTVQALYNGGLKND